MTSVNKEIENLLNKMKIAQTKDDAANLTNLLETANMFVPAKMPEDTDPELLKKIEESKGKETSIPEGAKPQPCILVNNEGVKYFPVFTSEEELNKGTNRNNYPIVLNIPFKVCLDVIMKSSDIEGAVFNPYNQNIIVNINKEEKTFNTQADNVPDNEVLFHAMLRQRIEAREIPKRLFDEGEEFINDIISREGECIIEFFEKSYENTKSCPYTADDFEIISLNISDNMQITRVSMPENYRYPGNASSIFITFDPAKKDSKYFVIVKTEGDQPDRLLQVNPTGKATDFGAAPEEGNELQHIITIASKL